MLYVAVDGDDIGQLLTQRIYKADNDCEVTWFSALITDTLAEIAKWVVQNQGEVLFCTGDNILFRISEALLDAALCQLKSDGFTVSVGIGWTLKEAHWALNVAKSLGKARIVHFDEVRSDIFGIEQANPKLNDIVILKSETAEECAHQGDETTGKGMTA